MTTPRETGYRFPAEWEQHEAIFLAWPHDRTTFPDLAGAEQAYVEMIRALRESEKVNLLVLNNDMRTLVLSLLEKNNVASDHVTFFLHDYADVWFRDFGPTFVVNREERQLAMVKWDFNAWGNKYPSLVKDGDVPAFLNKTMKLPFFPAGIVMEGGAIDTNGAGTLLTTTTCLLNKNRNPGIGREEIERVLRDFLNVSKIIWLSGGIAGDDTDAHVDNLARFVDERTVLCALEEDASDENYAALKANYDALRAATDKDGNTFRVVAMPMPRLADDERRYPASYMNFYIGNIVVLAPLYGHPNDARALMTLAHLFPTRRVVGVDCRALVAGSGAIHCVTQQQPRIF